LNISSKPIISENAYTKILENIIPSIDIKKTRFGLSGKNNIHTNTSGKLGNNINPRIKEISIYITSAKEPND
jgi:hypothetical protein